MINLKEKLKNDDNLLENYLLKYNFSSIVNENIRNNDIEKAIKLISSFLKKRGVYTIPVIEVVNVDSFGVFTVMAYTNDNKGCSFCWHRDNTTTLHSVMFTNDFDSCYIALSNGEPINWDAYVLMKGASVTKALQLVADVMNGRVKMNTKDLNDTVRSAQLWESVEDVDVITEATDGVIKELQRKKYNLQQRIKDWEKKGKDTTDLQSQYDQLCNELVDARVSVKSNVKVTPIEDPAVSKIQSRFEEEERALPEERFDDMESYVKNVILGLSPSALICGAPGVGKSFRVMSNIKKEGKVRGIDYEVIKGKATPMALYTLLHDFQAPGQLLVIDDADSIIKDDVMINLIKAATDSSDERIVAYASSMPPAVPEEKMMLYSDFEQDAKGIWRYPKNFVYEGGIIILTNLQAGAIDTAIRSRALICDLNFTTAEVLGLIEDLAPHISPGILTQESKDKALIYLEKLADSGAEMEISIRSFIECAKQYMSDAPMKAVERRIREQMRLKFLRAKSNAKY